MKIPKNLYQEFCEVTDIHPLQANFNLSEYSNTHYLSESSKSERLTAALSIFLEYILSSNLSVDIVDRSLIDHFIAKIDLILNDVLDNILHHPNFQALESIWRSLEYLVKQTDFESNIKIEMMDISKQSLLDDFDQVLDVAQSGLYKQIYEREYDLPGGEPFAAIISDFSFDASSQDVRLLRYIAKISAATHCPFLGAVSPEFFNKKDFESVFKIQDLNQYLDRSEYISWNTFRQSEDARYIGLTCPRFLLRLPYGQEKLRSAFYYKEQVFDSNEKYLWGSASFAMAANLTRSFKAFGWALQIRGIEAKVENLPLHQYDLGHGFLTKIPTEIMIPETLELELSHLGFIPLSYYKNSDFACFFSANSIQKFKQYLSKEATANSRINARLPYIFLSSRIAHYLKVLQRENIGSNISRENLENKLNSWLKTLVTRMKNPDTEQISKHPLREAEVKVIEDENTPGFYQINLHVIPHFQVEGVNVNLSVVSKLPNLK